MTSVSEQQVVDYLTELRDLEPEPAALSALAGRRTIVAPRRRRLRATRRTLALALAIVAGSSALAAATGVFTNPDPIPPARVVERSVPSAVAATVAVFDRPAEALDRSPSARAAIGAIRSPYVIDGGSVRSVGATPLGESAYVAFARTDLDALTAKQRQYEPPGGTQGVYVAVDGRYGGVGADGPFPLEDIERGAAWGIKEIPATVPADVTAAGRLLTAVVPNGVAQVEVAFRSGERVILPVSGNVVIAPVPADGVETLRWVAGDGETLRTIKL